MRTLLFVLTAVVGLLVLQVEAAMAHPPSDIQLNFNKKTHILTVTVFHQVKDPTTHYIKEVDVSLNDNQIITQKFTRQTDNAKQMAQYIIPDAAANSVLKVTGTCNIRGSLDKTLTVK